MRDFDAMNLSSHVLQRIRRLPAPLSRDVTVQRDLPVPMRDGAVLLADHWAPSSGADRLPTVLIRTPYGRAGLMDHMVSRPLAERGFQVLIQCTRGTFGSGGVFDPFRREREDGLDTLDWVVKQPWFGESIVPYGPSYMGHAQWAMSDQLPPAVMAMIPSMSESAITREFLRQDGFSLEVPPRWGVQVALQERRWALPRLLLDSRRHHRALFTLPLNQADVAAFGHRSDYIQNWTTGTAWKRSPRRSVWSRAGTTSSCPVSSATIWCCRARDAALGSRLVRGPTPPLRRKPPRCARPSTSGWRTLAATNRRRVPRYACMSWGRRIGATSRLGRRRDTARNACIFQPQAGPSGDVPADSCAPDEYRYDPADPTPAVGGLRLAFGAKAGRVDDTKLEARQDVLTYTTAVLEEDVEVIGDVAAEIWFRSSLAYADVFVRLCDVDARGRSFNVCDGLVSLTGADEITCATVQLWPTAYRFVRGHRIRVQVSSGAFPRYNRNPGSGEPRATATTLRTAIQQVFHACDHPSAIILPVRLGG